MAMERRFVSLSEDQLSSLDDSKDAKNTKRTVNRSINLFRQFLGEENAEFEQFSKETLCSNLRSFFASIRTVKGEELKKSSLYNIKYGLSKYLKDKCSLDINNDSVFTSAQRTFKAKLKDLQSKGKGAVVHKEQITSNDMERLNQPDNVAFNVGTPCGLQNKVWFDIMFHLCRRGRENQRQMTKSTFVVETDTSGREYVRQAIDEADKNHGADATPDDTIGEARMYAQGGTMCPVQSFKSYISKLHSACNDLWQRPLESFSSADNVWYCNSPLGKNSLSNMMSKISKCAKLSKCYTNHCIRATSISALDRAGFEARHIIRATGHRSETSIKSYSRRLTETTQQKMSDALNSALSERNQAEVNNIETMPELSAADLDMIFSNENDFSEISTATAEITPVTAKTPDATNYQQTINHQLNSIPQGGHSGYNIAPNISNCTVNFYFGNQ